MKLAVLVGLVILETPVKPSCAAFTCAGGYASCPDDNVQAASSGGRVYALIEEALNLPDEDVFPESGLSDPYVRIEVGSVKATTAVEDDTLNPAWQEHVDLGYHNSGDPVTITILDADSGLEFGDDVLYSIRVRIPWCSAFHAEVVTADCGGGYTYDCDIQGTAWSMPTQPFCLETSWLFLGGASDGVGGEGGCGVDNNYPCLKLSFAIVPFQVEIVETYSGDPFLLTVAGYDGSFAGLSDYDDYGKVYSDQSQLLGYEIGRTMFDDLRGGIMVRTDSDEAGTVGGGKAVDLAINAESTVWVCKWKEDTIAFGDPSWLTAGGWELKSSTRTYLYGYTRTTEYFACWSKLFPPTERNFWGGLESDPVTLYANGVNGGEDKMYMVVIVPTVDDQKTTTRNYSSELDSTAFWRGFLEHIVTGVVFLWVSKKFLAAKDFRVELVEAHLVQTAVESNKQGGSRNVLRHLVASHGMTKNNVEFRRNLCLAGFASRLSLLVPIFVLWAWGLSAIITVNPPAVGFLLCFVGTSYAIGWFGFNHWRARGWLMDGSSLCCILVSVQLLLAFLAVVVFVDPATFFGSEEVDFCGLTGVFFTLDILPLVFLLFQNDSKLKRSMNKLGNVVEKFTRCENTQSFKTRTKLYPRLKRTLSEETMLNLDSANIAHTVVKTGAETKMRKLMARNPFYSLLGDCYTIVASLKTFRFSVILSASLLMVPPSWKKRRNRLFYGLSLVFLLSYLVISAVWTKYGHLALLNIATVTVLDSCHFGIHRGATYWSPWYGIVLMGAARVAIMSFMAELWIVGYSIALVVYGGALVREVIDNRLPQLSKEEAGAVVFLGREPRIKKCDDVGATPEVVLGFMCLYFVIILVILLYGGSAYLPMSTVPVWGQQWPAYVFPLAGILLVISSGFFVACLRSLSLVKQGLLPARFRAIFLWHRDIGLPAILAGMAAFSGICTGLLVWVATGSSAQFKVCLCLPAIVLLGRATYSRWVKNDYTLVDWPPDRDKDKAAGIRVVGEEDEDDPTPDGVKVADSLEGGSLHPDKVRGGNGGSSESVIERGEGSGVILPAISPTGDAFEGDVKMPALPLKSVLPKTHAVRFEDTNVMPSTVASGGVHEGGDAAFARSFSGDESDAMARPKYVRRRSSPGSKDEEDGELQPGFWTIIGEAISKIIERERPTCLISKGKRKKHSLKVGSVEHDGEAEQGIPLQGKPPEGRRGRNDDVDEEQVETRVDSLSFRRAFLEGYLLPHEYRACYGFAACLLLIVVMGYLLAREEPRWVGHLIWTGLLAVIFTFLPAAKWFGTYEVDTGMKLFLLLAGVLLTTSCVLMFMLVLDGEAFQDHSLAVLNAFLAYPIVAYGIFSVFQAIDGPTPSPSNVANAKEQLDEDMHKPSRRLDKAVSCIIEYFLTFKFLLVIATSLWLLQSFFWGGFYVCFGLTVAVALSVMVGRMIRGYTAQGSVVSRSYAGARTRFFFSVACVGCLVAALWGVGAEAFYFTVFFVIWMVRIVITVATRLLELEPDTILYFAPWAFPAFTYDARTGNLVDKTVIACQAFWGMLVGIAWGVAVAVFVEPLGLGVVIACIFLIALASATAWCMTYPPNRLGIAVKFLDSSLVFEAGSVARSCFITNHTGLFEVDCPEFSDHKKGNPRSAAMDSTRFEARRSAVDLAMGLEEKKKLLRVVLDEEIGSDRLRFDALYTMRDAIMEAFVSGKGPLGPIGLYGLWFKILRLLTRLSRIRHFRCFEEGRNPLLKRYFPDGQRRDAYTLSPPLNYPEILLEILNEERELQRAFRDELKCMMHLQVLALISAEARLQREEILFRKFLKDNHFNLLSNGIVLPKNIHTSNSFASVNIPMVAIWLSSLTKEERQRFHILRRKFSEMQSYRESEIVITDEAHQNAAKELEEERKPRVRIKSEKQRGALVKRRADRADAWKECLSVEDQRRFESVRTQWLDQKCVMVHTRDQELRENFEKNVLLHGEEVNAFAREILEKINLEGRDCGPGTHGRERQFIDPEFPPDNSSVGNAQCLQQLAQQWKVSLSVNPNIRLFDEGTDPDDVRQGAFRNAWLLSALSMISAATVGDGGVDEQIAQLFVSPIGRDGCPVLESCSGAYAVKIMVDGEWQVVIVDDYFPAIEFDKANDDNMKLAVGHSFGAHEMWVSLLEKAYAKFYGSYAALETGFVHQALTAFTGAQSEEIFLATAGRGIGKKGLWKKMRRYRRNGYIMGAGTITSNLVERQIQDSGLVFGAAYTILEVLDSYGEQLIKLRNPPGNHEEWRGDWGDHSPLWTRRRRRRLGFVNNDRDNAFWMSFNDFCIVFRSLYVCRWYDPRKWATVTRSGSWDMREDLFTAAGLPSAQQKVCELENNPQFTLEIDHQTDMKISLIQTGEEVQPAACFVFREDRPRHGLAGAPRRVSKLSQEILVASTGPPIRERERNIYVTLGAGDYVVMCAAFMAGMEGSFKVEITTNSKRLKFSKLWPPPEPDEVEKVFDDGKTAGRIANLGLKKLGSIGAGIGDNLNKNADRVVETL